jgi:hypothetical protein
MQEHKATFYRVLMKFSKKVIAAQSEITAAHS